MKILKLLKNIGLVLFLGFAITACSSSDDNKGGEGSKLLENVPKGEIVSEAQRFITLTGYEENVASKSISATVLNADSQKWWTLKDSGYEYWCGSEHEKENMGGGSGVIGFSPDGKIYAKYEFDTTPSEYGKWKWANSSKSKITIIYSLEDEETFEFTELNNTGFVIAEITSDMGCEGVYWEQYKLGN